MKRLLFCCFLLPCQLYAQQFSFKLRFADAAGNRDTVTLGYDINGSNAINAAFGEQDITGQAWKNGLDVRAGNMWWKEYATGQSFLQGKNAFVDAFINAQPMQSKTQVVKNVGGCQLGTVWKNDFWKVIPIIELDIKTSNWPVTAYWDHAAFNDNCRKGSVLTARHPGGWWDADYDKFKAGLLQQDSIVFWNNGYSYTDGTNKTPVIWVAFADSSLTFDDLEMEWLLSTPHMAPKPAFNVYPNPAGDRIHIDAPATIQAVHIYTVTGQPMLYTHNTVIDIAALCAGVYFIEATDDNGMKYISRFMKE